MNKKYSSISIASFFLSIFSVFLICSIYFYVLKVLHIQSIESMVHMKSMSMYVIAVLLFWFLNLVAMGLGLGSMMQPGKKEVLGIVGFSISFLYCVFEIVTSIF